MYTSLGMAAKATGVSKSALRVMLLPLIPLADPILLVAIVALYVIVVLLGFVGIHVPVPGFR